LSPYTIIENYSSIYNPFSIPYASIVTAGNPGLSWETVKQFNTGIDFQLFKGRITGSIDGYWKSSANLILSAVLDLTTGVGNIEKNSASMTGRGMDISISSQTLQGAFKWNTEATLSLIRNKVTNYEQPDYVLPAGYIVGGNGINITPMKGITPYALFSYPFAGLDPATGDPMGYLGKNTSTDYQALFNQSFDTANINYHGSAIPTAFGNFTNTFTYKGISLTINIAYKFDYFFKKNAISYLSLFYLGSPHADYPKRWQQPGDEKTTNIPSMVYPVTTYLRDQFYTNSSVNILKGDNIRLQYIRISYDLSRSRVKKLPVSNIQLYANIDNIGLLWRANKEDLDPDYNSGNGVYLPPKRISAGIKVDF
jgi:hypothetical protein